MAETVRDSCKSAAQPAVGKVVDFTSLDNSVQALIQFAADIREKAYCPYSQFKVGAALRCADGAVFTGCNIESAAYSPTICAERTAISKAVSEGHCKFTALAVVADLADSFTSPCGVCRQTYCEFVEDSPIYLGTSTMDQVLVTSLKELLPMAFAPRRK